MKSETKRKNNLWLARKRSGLDQKQVARLLKQKTQNEISRYERGTYLPNLETALKLEIIYKMPIRLLFNKLFQECIGKIAKVRDRLTDPLPDEKWVPEPAEQLEQEEFCFYSDLLKNNIPNEIELKTVEKHVINLMHTTGDYRSGRRPFS